LTGRYWQRRGIPSGAAYLGRGVRVTAVRSQLFVKGLVAKDSIDMNGNNIMTDSFDSTNPNYSTNGVYIASKHKATGMWRSIPASLTP